MTRLPTLALLCLACGGNEFNSEKAEQAPTAGEGGENAGRGGSSAGGKASAGESGEAGSDQTGGTATGGAGGSVTTGGSAGDGMPGGSAGAAGIAITGGAAGAGGSGGSQRNTIDSLCTGRLTGRLRDFQPTSNPDFEPQNAKPSAANFFNQVETGIVQNAIDSNTWRPIYAGTASGTNTTIGPASFATWFRDSAPTNMAIDLGLDFQRLADQTIFAFARSPFLPIDDGPNCPVMPQTPCMLGNSVNYMTHNYAMTFELHVFFRHHAGDIFVFEGDDDAWAFVDGQLKIDLGGVHQSERAEASFAGLGDGSVYRLDFFWAERHVTQSNFRIETNVDVQDCGTPAPVL